MSALQDRSLHDSISSWRLELNHRDSGIKIMTRVKYVNGMQATIESFDAASKGLRVITKTGHRIVIWPWTNADLDNVTYYPIRPGYASTIVKFQGAELEHVTVWLDVPGIPGAAYTAMSRVKLGENCLIGGNVKALHFMPAA